MVAAVAGVALLAAVVSGFAAGPTGAPGIALTHNGVLYVVDPDGRNLRALARQRVIGVITDPAWSSDHLRIAYGLFYKESDNEIGVIRADGTRRRDDVFGLTLAGDPAWSPDDKRIAVVTFAGGFPPRTSNTSIVATTVVAPYRQIRLTRFQQFEGDPTWSPDGRTLAFTRAGRQGGTPAVYLIPARGGAAHRLTSGADADWSRNGSHLLLADRGDIFVVGRDGSGRRLVVGGKALDSAPRWSPDNSRLAFLRTRGDCTGFACLRDLWTSRSDGSHQQLVVRKVEAADW